MVDYAVHPARQAPQAAVDTTDSSWAAASIPAETVYVLVHPTVDMHVTCDSASADPASDGVIYAGGQTHIVECRSATTIRAKNAAGQATGKLHWTGFGN